METRTKSAKKIIKEVVTSETYRYMTESDLLKTIFNVEDLSILSVRGLLNYNSHKQIKLTSESLKVTIVLTIDSPFKHMVNNVRIVTAKGGTILGDNLELLKVLSTINNNFNIYEIDIKMTQETVLNMKFFSEIVEEIDD